MSRWPDSDRHLAVGKITVARILGEVGLERGDDLRRLAEYHDLPGALGRRALIERAKGILTERHSIDEQGAFEMLRVRSRIDNRQLIDLATAVAGGHRPLPTHPSAPERPQPHPVIDRGVNMFR